MPGSGCHPADHVTAVGEFVLGVSLTFFIGDFFLTHKLGQRLILSRRTKLTLRVPKEHLERIEQNRIAAA